MTEMTYLVNNGVLNISNGQKVIKNLDSTLPIVMVDVVTGFKTEHEFEIETLPAVEDEFGRLLLAMNHLLKSCVK